MPSATLRTLFSYLDRSLVHQVDALFFIALAGILGTALGSAIVAVVTPLAAAGIITLG